MRATVYMLGETQNPRWSESKTSFIVGTTSLGIALGAPLAGLFSGRKIELGLVPIGALGMAIAAALAGVFIDYVSGLVTCIILIGFFWAGIILMLVAIVGYLLHKISAQMAWLAGIIGFLFVVISLIVGRI